MKENTQTLNGKLETFKVNSAILPGRAKRLGQAFWEA